MPEGAFAPWTCEVLSTEELGDDKVDDFDGTGVSANISSTWPDSKLSLEEDIGNRGIFC